MSDEIECDRLRPRLWNMVGHRPIPDNMMLERVYVGFNITPIGSVIGLAYGFVCGAICGAILAWLYNFFAERVGAGVSSAATRSA